MDYAVIVAKQVVIMFILIGIGIYACRKNILSLEATRGLSDLILIIVGPCLMITAFNREKNIDELKGLVLAFVLAVIFNAMAVLLSNLIVKKREDSNYRIERMGAVYSNCGFMAFPLLGAILGSVGIFYGAVYVAVFNIFLWSSGVITLSSWQQINKKKILINPGTVGALIGLLLYLTQIKLPSVIQMPIEYVADLNTPLSMIMIGVFLARVNVFEMIKTIRIYFVSLLRLIVLPLIMLLFIKLANISNLFNGADIVVTTILVCCACPAAVSVILMVSKNKLDDTYGAKILAMSTLLSLISLPIITLLAMMI